MKKIFAILSLGVFACSGPVSDNSYDTGVDGYTYDESWFEEDVDIAQLMQNLTAASGYGTIVGTDGTRCPAGLSGDICRYPRDKDAYYRFRSSTCSSWWQSRVVEAWNDWLVVDRDLGWTVRDPAPGGFADYYLECGDAGSNNLGYFSPKDSDIKGTEPEKYVTHSTGLIKIDATDIQGVSTWSTRSDVERQRFARNVIIHELFHSSGLGHPLGGEQPGSVMRGPGAASTSTWWSGLKYPTGTELGWIEDYIP